MNTAEYLSFSCLNLRKSLLDNLSSLKYLRMTPIQAQSLPIMLNGQNIIAQAKTGSGKTAAFGLALLNRITVENIEVQALVLCPTRELAEQVTQTLRQLARMMPNVRVLNVSGGMPMKPQVSSLRHGVHVVVGTPGRVQHHLDNGVLLINKLQMLVLDEADRMLDMGFFDAIYDIIRFCPQEHQTLLFSATFPEAVKNLASEFMQNPVHVNVTEMDQMPDIEQICYEVPHPAEKFALLKAILLHYKPVSTLIFCNTKLQTKEIVARLKDIGFSATALHGDMEQRDRDIAVIRFKNQSCSILVATDVAARGLDIKELPAIINYEIARDVDVHLHRIGRTGRAGNKGLALNFITHSDMQQWNFIEKQLNQSTQWGKIQSLIATENTIFSPDMITLCLNVGRKDKIRPGDILGALTQDAQLPGMTIGKIDITAQYSYVAIHKSQAKKAIAYFVEGKLKGRKVNLINM